jgi:calcineurin-like phosphoesterase family protein
MNRDMVRRWNERVSTPDTVYHLGDFALGDPAMYPAYRKQLNGSIIPVRGNHDARMESVISWKRRFQIDSLAAVSI